jgi:hypothetical protein
MTRMTVSTQSTRQRTPHTSNYMHTTAITSTAQTSSYAFCIALYYTHALHSAVRFSSAQEEKRRAACAAAPEQVLGEQKEQRKKMVGEKKRAEEGMPNGKNRNNKECAKARKPAKRKKMGTRVRRRELPVAMENRPNQAPRRGIKQLVRATRRNVMHTHRVHVPNRERRKTGLKKFKPTRQEDNRHRD